MRWLVSASLLLFSLSTPALAQTADHKRNLDKIFATVSADFCPGADIRLFGSMAPSPDSYELIIGVGLEAEKKCKHKPGVYSSKCTRLVEGGWFCTRPTRTDPVIYVK